MRAIASRTPSSMGPGCSQMSAAITSVSEVVSQPHAALRELVAQLGGVGEVAVVAERHGARAGVAHDGLGVGPAGRAGGGVAARGRSPPGRCRACSAGSSKTCGDEAEVLQHRDVAAVGHGDARRSPARGAAGRRARSRRCARRRGRARRGRRCRTSSLLPGRIADASGVRLRPWPPGASPRAPRRPARGRAHGWHRRRRSAAPARPAPPPGRTAATPCSWASASSAIRGVGGDRGDDGRAALPEQEMSAPPGRIRDRRRRGPGRRAAPTPRARRRAAVGGVVGAARQPLARRGHEQAVQRGAGRQVEAGGGPASRRGRCAGTRSRRWPARCRRRAAPPRHRRRAGPPAPPGRRGRAARRSPRSAWAGSARRRARCTARRCRETTGVPSARQASAMPSIGLGERVRRLAALGVAEVEAVRDGQRARRRCRRR